VIFMVHPGGLILRTFLVAGLLASDAAMAYCSTRERIQLRNEGVPPMEIDRLCSGGVQPGMPNAPMMPLPQQQMPRPRFATQCVTNAGPCPMAVAMPIGSVCACYTPWGAVPGMAQ